MVKNKRKKMTYNSRAGRINTGKFIINFSAIGSGKKDIKKHETFSSLPYLESVNDHKTTPQKITTSQSYIEENKTKKKSLWSIEEINREPFIANAKDFCNYHGIKFE